MGNWGGIMGGWGGQSWSFMAGWGWLFLAPVLIWSLIWKGLALWKSARRGANVWFVILLLVNTVGILDILYLYVFSKKSHSV
ncbi:MAG: DUF5652 family protein [Patescibacteria group bacterium]